MGSLSPQDLPPSSSPNLALVEATPEERKTTHLLNSSSWRGALTLAQYVDREAHLASQALTANGGITYWILTDSTLPPNQRPILSACETLRKKAWVARAGDVQEARVHGIGSVFCRPEYRGRGYAKRMMDELGKKLEGGWGQEAGAGAAFSVLYSDIGKQFYAKSNWIPFNSTHISLPPTPAPPSPPIHHVGFALPNPAGNPSNNPFNHFPPDVTPIWPYDIVRQTRADITHLFAEVKRKSKALRHTTVVALIPDAETMTWHHAREEFHVKTLHSHREPPGLKGAYAVTQDAEIACSIIWARTFGATSAGNILHILRISIRNEDELQWDCKEDVEELGGLVIACLRKAQEVAWEWGMGEVQMWNPSELTVWAVQRLDDRAKLVEREQESIASLRFAGPGRVEWIGNERFGWI